MTHAGRAMSALALVLAAGSLLFSASLVTRIQNQREDAIRTACVEQNRRHDETIAALDHLIAKLPPGSRRRRAKQNREGTVFLLEAIVPHRDCEALVAKSLGK